MMLVYGRSGDELTQLDPEAEGAAPIPKGAVWIDLYQPSSPESDAVKALDYDVPTLAEMEEIEVSNRLYHAGDAQYLTVVLPGSSSEGVHIAGPVTFILSPRLLVTVRHHAPRPFETFPSRAGATAAGCADPAHVFLGLVSEIVGRLADLLEGAGRVLDTANRAVFAGDASGRPDLLEDTLEEVGRQGELLGRIRLAMMTLERMLGYFATTDANAGTKPYTKAALNDLHALSDHADFLSARVGLSVDATLGMINLAQNATVRIVSVVAVLFLPPTLVASIYGMNFPWLPALDQPGGFWLAAALMVASAAGTYAVFRWKDWL